MLIDRRVLYTLYLDIVCTCLVGVLEKVRLFYEHGWHYRPSRGDSRAKGLSWEPFRFISAIIIYKGSQTPSDQVY